MYGTRHFATDGTAPTTQTGTADPTVRRVAMTVPSTTDDGGELR